MTGQEASTELNELKDRVPVDRLLAYAWLWQFETWLRRMVYIELRACYGDCWISNLKGYKEHPYVQDKNLTHMPTREVLPTSFMQLSDLLATIKSNWSLFELYLPPQNLWEAKMCEITQIRHRVAHFRSGNIDDITRVKMILREIDNKFWSFCSSYNSSLTMMPLSNDALMREFLDRNPFPRSETTPHTLASIHMTHLQSTVAVRIEFTARPWAEQNPPNSVAGEKGYFYNVWFSPRDNRCFDHRNFLQSTKAIHSNICHIFLEGCPSCIRVTVPTVLGTQAVVKITNDLLIQAYNAVRPCPPSSVSDGLSERYEQIEQIVRDSPEYVIGPSDPLSIIYPDTPCSFFSASL